MPGDLESNFAASILSETSTSPVPMEAKIINTAKIMGRCTLTARKKKIPHKKSANLKTTGIPNLIKCFPTVKFTITEPKTPNAKIIPRFPSLR